MVEPGCQKEGTFRSARLSSPSVLPPQSRTARGQSTQQTAWAPPPAYAPEPQHAPSDVKPPASTYEPSGALSHAGPRQSHDEILSALERLGSLHQKGVLSDQEFASKKADLLSRL
jgi:hypothetical protein